MSTRKNKNNHILIWVFMLLFTTIVNAQDLKEIICNSEAIYEVKAENITENSVIINWFSIADSDDFVIVYGLKGFKPRNKKQRIGKIRSRHNTELFTGLSPETVYDFYIKLKCQKGRFFKRIRVKTLKSSEIAKVSTFSTRMARSMSTLSSTLEQEKQALWDFYNTTNGTQWRNTTSNRKPWSLSIPVSDWHGITVDADGHVTKINLGSNNLVGTIPSSISKLTRLTYLNLPYNKISSIPAEIGNLNEVTWLQLTRNQITQLPVEVFNLTKLTHLFLDYNKIMVLPAEIGKLVNLKQFNFSGNAISVLPSTIGDLSSLTTLNLASTKLSGPFPNDLLRLNNLGILNIHRNNFTGSIPEGIGNMVNLHSVYLNFNKFTGAIPLSIVNLTRLGYLHLHGNELSGDLSHINWSGLINLSSLNLGANKFSGKIPVQLGTLSKLRYLNLGRNQLTGEVPLELQGLVNLSGMYLFDNHFSGGLPNIFGSLLKLQTLTINKNNFEGVLPASLSQIPNLRYLRIMDNNFKGKLPFNSTSNKFQWLHIEGNKYVFNDLESDFPGYSSLGRNFKYTPQKKVDSILEESQEVGKTVTLTSNDLTSVNNSYQWYKDGVLIPGATNKDLVLNNVQESAAGVYHFTATNSVVTGLTLERHPITLIVSVPKCQVSEAEKNALWSFYTSTNGANWKNTVSGNKPWSLGVPVCDWYGVTVGVDNKVVELKLTSNNVSGTIPSEIGNLSSLSVLDLRSNLISGVSTGIGSLLSLKKLYLYENQLTVLPESIGNLSSLETFYLNRNQITVLPESIGNLTNLKTLAAHENLLTSLPTSINTLTKLKFLYINKNKLSGSIPISNTVLINTLLEFVFSDNYLVFSDFESNHTNYKTEISRYIYSPQAKVDVVEEKVVQSGRSITLSSTDLTSSNNSYQWFKNGVAISGATSKDLVLNNVQESAAGVYHFTATNSVVTGLTLERRPITLFVSETPVITPVPLATIESTHAGSFRPVYEKKYMISGWVKEKNVAGIKSSNYTSSAIRLYTVGLASGSLEEPVFIGDFHPTGDIIDGWQRIEGIFKINSYQSSDQTAVNNLVIELKNTSADVTSYFDDIRIYPFNGSMKSFVYDDDTKKLMAELDENNYATYYEYDKEGGLVRVKKETKKGIFTIQETRSSNAK
ncbi:Leucine-rich repeat (LRR) protein [Tenacibaculum sp. MAR_2009_124]|uniref:leucine-rich repeat domain-containing protein n=1 Tax=Tenacibaculum sp. MAR_2009_124 TaxID=1250059 RepID=UPI00089AB55E|nr:hypothetical protein [Tenacibaculum sp. MAR_2009_124]SEC56912.1 Leucine-rich repeat (LRR) protein [Tenacibaculum sp. MAR_2009_124]